MVIFTIPFPIWQNAVEYRRLLLYIVACMKNGKGDGNMVQVVAALIWRNGRFMACRRPAHKARGLLWEFVGGKTEPGETREEALIRECREELGITVHPLSIFTEVDHVYPDITIHLTLFEAQITEGEPQMLEHNDIRWLLPSEIGEYTFCPADKDILALIAERYAEA